MKADIVKFEKGRVVIPRRLCQEFGIGKGTKVTVAATPEGILLTPIGRARSKSLRGKYQHLPLMETLREMKREERER